MSMVINIVIVVVVIIGLGYLYTLSTSERWQETKGQITKLEASENFNRINSANPNVVEFPVEVEYQFSANGGRYTGNKIYAALPNVFSDQIELETFMAENSLGSSVTVYYQQSDPSQSALRKPKISTLGYAVLIFIVVIVFVSIFYVANRYVFND